MSGSFLDCTGYLPSTYASGISYLGDPGKRYSIPSSIPSKPTPKPSIMNTVFSDIKSFISEHRTIIYGIVLLLLVDHFFLGNKLTARIKATAEKMLGFVETKVDHAIGHPVVVAPAITPPTS